MAGGAIVLADDDHAVAPLQGLRHGLNHAHADVAINVCFYLFLPVEWNRVGRGDVSRCGVGVKVNLQGRPGHHREHLMWALVESARREMA